MRCWLIIAVLLGAIGCLEAEEIRRLELVTAETVPGIEALPVPVSALPGTGPAPGSSCDFSFGGPQPCGPSLWCDPGAHTLVRRGKGKMGVVGVCRERGWVGEPCEKTAHCRAPFTCEPAAGGRVCTDPTPLALPADDGRSP